MQLHVASYAHIHRLPDGRLDRQEGLTVEQAAERLCDLGGFIEPCYSLPEVAVVPLDSLPLSNHPAASALVATAGNGERSAASVQSPAPVAGPVEPPSGMTKAQAECMRSGALFGFPGAIKKVQKFFEEERLERARNLIPREVC